jgi:hypothetical protein
MEKSLKKKITWCVVNDKAIQNMSLCDYIHNAQLSIEKKYHLVENEESTVIEILQVYKQQLIQYYFKGLLSNYYNLTEKDYFFVTLTDFLRKHEYDTFFNGKELRINKNKLNDYGVAYYKLYYISQLYCIKLFGKKVTEDSVAHIIANNTKKILDTGDDI